MGVKSITMTQEQKILVDLPDIEKRILVKFEDGQLIVGDDKCRHRGGPLHLCYKDSSGKNRCPWHDRPVLKIDAANEVCCIFLKEKQKLSLVRNSKSTAPWPIRKLSND
jgi:hypothetical protein